MNLKMESQSKTKNSVRSLILGIGAAILYLLLGTVLDYVLTQILSQYFLRDCSEDCYFRYFNAIFIGAAFLSVVGGVRAGMRAYKRSSETQ
jgi:ABC-type multidrug transport system fused ATPase/permease subunit